MQRGELSSDVEALGRLLLVVGAIWRNWGPPLVKTEMQWVMVLFFDAPESFGGKLSFVG